MLCEKSCCTWAKGPNTIKNSRKIRVLSRIWTVIYVKKSPTLSALPIWTTLTKFDTIRVNHAPAHDASFKSIADTLGDHVRIRRRPNYWLHRSDQRWWFRSRTIKADPPSSSTFNKRIIDLLWSLFLPLSSVSRLISQCTPPILWVSTLGSLSEHRERSHRVSWTILNRTLLSFAHYWFSRSDILKLRSEDPKNPTRTHHGRRTLVANRYLCLQKPQCATEIKNT